MLDAGVFARHLDLTPLGGRRRGKVRCIFHQERTASLSLDLEAGVFHCFGCGQQGGITRFAALVGERADTAELDTRPEPDQTPWLIASRLAGRQAWTRAVDLYEAADWIRRTRRDVAHVRAIATEADWDALQRAAHLETVAHWAESHQDDALGRGPSL